MTGTLASPSLSSSSAIPFVAREKVNPKDLRVRDQRTTGSSFSPASALMSAVSGSSDTRTDVLNSIVAMIPSAYSWADEIGRLTSVTVDSFISQYRSTELPRILEAVTALISARMDVTIAQRYLSEIDSLDLEADGFLVPTVTARRQIIVMAALASAVYGPIVGRSAQPWTMSPTEDGGLLPEWRGPKGDLEIHIGPEGRMAYVLVTNEEGQRKYSGAPIASPAEILRLVSFIF